jgi:hypothetical protein
MDKRLSIILLLTTSFCWLSLAQEAPQSEVKPVVVEPIAAAEVPTRMLLEPTEKQVQAAKAIEPFDVKMLSWENPHGGYMIRLKESIIKAHAEGNIEERDRLLKVYEARAKVYLRK